MAKATGCDSKDWTDVARPNAPEMDFVFTVCDQTAGEACPDWPGRPMTAHWSLPDPLAFQGTEPEKRAMFADVYRMLNTRLDVFVNLPLAGLDRLTVQQRLDEMSDRQNAPA